jgi:LacI family transcriptional regulator
MAAGYHAALALLDEGPPTAIVAMSDQLALGAIEAARERGVRIPDQLSIVGFDDTPQAGAQPQGLTTVHQPHSRKGSLAAEMLLSTLESHPVSAGSPLDHRLVVRDTTAPPGSSGGQSR